MRKIKKIIIIATTIVFLLTSFSTAIGIDFTSQKNLKLTSEINVSYHFAVPEIESIELQNQDFSRIKLEGEFISDSSNPGKPVLPSAGCKILLPYGYNFENVIVTSQEESYLSVNNIVEPGQQYYPLSYEGEINFTSPDPLVYNSMYKYPGKKYDIVSIQRCRGYNILVLKLYPVQYDPLNNKIVFSRSVNLNIKTSAVDFSEISKLHNNFRGINEDNDKILDMIDNKETINTYPEQSPNDNYELLIITTQALKNSNQEYNFQALRDAKNSIGINTKIVTVEEIENNQSGGSTKEKIRNFIKFAYSNWNTNYVLLGGDDNVVPAKIVYIQDVRITNMPSDLYYACLDDPAPSGKSTDDLYAEVYVGRACVGNINEVSNFVKKTINYMNSADDYLSKALWVGEYLGFGGVANYAKNSKEQNIGHCEDDGYTTDGLPEEGDDSYDVTRLYEKDGNWGKNDIMDKINEGHHLINHLGHANYHMNMKMSDSDIDSLTNDNCFFGYSQGCNSGGFDGTDCAAEHFTVKTPYAAFGGVWNARYGWGRRGSTDGPSNRYDREFWDAIYGEDKNTFGWASHDSKEDNFYRINEGCMKWCYYGTNLFGDPSLVVKGSGPELAFSPESHDFGSMYEGTTEYTTFEIWSDNGMDLDYTINEDYNWLSVTPDSGSTSFDEHDTITVSIDTSGMSNGEHSADIQIVSNGGIGFFHVEVLVGPVLGYTPNTYDFGKMGEQATDSFNFYIRNRGVERLDYSISVDEDWLNIDPVSGSCETENDTITASINTADMQNGEYNTEITINSNGGTGKIKVHVLVGKVLGYDPKSYDFGNVEAGSVVSTVFNIWNRGLDNLEYSFSHNCGWLSISPNSGNSWGEKDEITVTVNTQDLSFIGSHSCDILINSNGGEGVFKVSIDVLAVFESTSSDGEIYHTAIDSSNQGGFFKARNALTGDVSDNQDTITVGLEAEMFAIDPDGNPVLRWIIHRGYLMFDTSDLDEIPEGAVVTDAWLSMYAVDFKANHFFDFIITNGQPNYPHDPLRSSDYDISKYHGVGGRYSPTEDDMAVKEYKKILLNDLGKTWINENGLTKLCLLSSMDWENQPVIGKNWASGYANEGLYKPKLCIGYGYTPNPPENPIPADGAINVNTNVDLSVEVSSPDNNPLSVYFFSGRGEDAVSNKNLIGISNVSSGETASVEWTGLNYSSEYHWYVIVSNGECSIKSSTWCFKTRDANNPPSKPVNPVPADKAVDVDLEPLLSVDVFDEDNDKMIIGFYIDDILIDKVDAHSGDTASTKVTKSLDYETTYSWYTVADDGVDKSKSEIWSFTTKKQSSDNHAPNKPVNPDPEDNEKNVDIKPTLSVDVSDPDSDDLNVVFYLNDEEIGGQSDVPSGGSAKITTDELEYNKTYRWYAVADDGKLKNTSKEWTFKTIEQPVNISIDIEKPKEKSLYFRNNYKFRFLFTLIIGKIDIEFNVTGEDKEQVDTVKLFIKDELQDTFENEPYNWTWDKFSFGRKIIKVIAYDSKGKELASDEIIVWKFF